MYVYMCTGGTSKGFVANERGIAMFKYACVHVVCLECTGTVNPERIASVIFNDFINPATLTSLYDNDFSRVLHAHAHNVAH